MPRLNVELSENVYRKLMRMKTEAKLGGKGWPDYFSYLTRNTGLNDTISEAISRSTKEGLGKVWAENFTMNIPLIVGDSDKYPEGKDKWSIGLLPKHKDVPALIIAAGPSIRQRGHLKLLADRGWKGISLACDRMLIPLLELGFVPTYVMSVDGNRELIRKFFDSPLVDKYAKDITGIFASTVATNAIKRFKEAGGTPRFFHGMLDNFYADQTADSVTSWMNHMTGSTALSCGGNVGSTGFTLALYLHASPICYVGLDYGYTMETPIEQTAYYDRLKTPGLSLEAMLQFYTTGWNPDFGNQYRTDVVFLHYREALLEMIATAKTIIYNATESGAVHGPGIKGIKFSELLDKFGER